MSEAKRYHFTYSEAIKFFCDYCIKQGCTVRVIGSDAKFRNQDSTRRIQLMRISTLDGGIWVYDTDATQRQFLVVALPAQELVAIVGNTIIVTGTAPDAAPGAVPGAVPSAVETHSMCID